MQPKNARWSKPGLVCVLGACGVTLAGCASKALHHPQGGCPDDFAISLTLLAPAAGVGPAWFVLEPDGVLRAVLGERQAASPLPPMVRTLKRTEVESVWRTSGRAGLVGGSARPSTSEVRAMTGGGERALALVYAAADGQKRFVSIPASDASRAAAVSDLAKELGELAWLPAASPGR